MPPISFELLMHGSHLWPDLCPEVNSVASCVRSEIIGSCFWVTAILRSHIYDNDQCLVAPLGYLISGSYSPLIYYSTNTYHYHRSIIFKKSRQFFPQVVLGTHVMKTFYIGQKTANNCADHNTLQETKKGFTLQIRNFLP